MKKSEQSLREMWDTIKQSSINAMGAPEGEEREKGTERMFKEIIAENMPNLMKDSSLHIQEAQ